MAAETERRRTALKAPSAVDSEQAKKLQALGYLTGSASETGGPLPDPKEAIRVMQGLIALSRKTPAEQLERAASKALQRAGWRLRDLKQALAEPANVVQVDFLERHPLIRDMDAYRLPFPHE